jgi:hypothetical protein
MIRRSTLLFFLAVLALPGRAPAEEAALGPGSKIESLAVGSTTYLNVLVLSVNARTVMITHSTGMASVHLRDLSPVWRARFHYDAAAEAAAEEADKAAPPPVPIVHRAKPVTPVKVSSKFDALLRKFGQPAVVQPEVDLRPVFFKLELGVKNQGQRPSCAVFAIVSALEYQNAMLTGKVEKFSEEYLIWAVRKTTMRLPPAAVAGPADPSAKEYQDEGFALTEVVAALRAYGIPLQSSMPNTFGSKIDAIEDPTPAVVEEARNHQRVFVQPLPGRDRPTRINNIVQALDSGFPVAIGMGWPAGRIVNGFLSSQKPPPDSGHAVTLVGYKSDTGRIEDAYFIFKNSWGPRWGQGGYGTVTYGYLSYNIDEAVLLEVQTRGT